MYLLDTCALLWFLDDAEQLSREARDVIGKSNELYFSIASLWEIAIKKSINKLDLEESVTDIENICDKYDNMILSCYGKRVGSNSVKESKLNQL